MPTRTIRITDGLYRFLLGRRGPRRGGKTMSDVIQSLLPEDIDDALERYEAGEIDEDELEQLAPGVFDTDEDDDDEEEDVDEE